MLRAFVVGAALLRGRRAHQEGASWYHDHLRAIGTIAKLLARSEALLPLGDHRSGGFQQGDPLRLGEVAGSRLAPVLLPAAQCGPRVAAEEAVDAVGVVAERGQRDLDLLALLAAEIERRLDRRRIGRDR